MKHLVLIGAGQAHVHLLSTLLKQPLTGVQITLVSAYSRHLCTGMVAGYVAGHYTLADCEIALEPFLKDESVTWLQCNITGLNAQSRSVTLEDGRRLDYDVLSIDSGPVQDPQKIDETMPGARDHALFMYPVYSFFQLWPKVLTMGQQKSLRLAIVGGGAAGFELACAVALRLSVSSVTLISDDHGANYPVAVQAMITQALRDRLITVIAESAVGIVKGEVILAGGGRLACDVPIIAFGHQAPDWLQGSGLALDTQGFIAVDACQRSSSHPQVFAACDVSRCIDLNPPDSTVDAENFSVLLIKNLRSVLAGSVPKPYTPPNKKLRLLFCGDRFAIASWGAWAIQGRWLWWLKDRIDRRLIKKYKQAASV